MNPKTPLPKNGWPECKIEYWVTTHKGKKDEAGTPRDFHEIGGVSQYVCCNDLSSMLDAFGNARGGLWSEHGGIVPLFENDGTPYLGIVLKGHKGEFECSECYHIESNEPIALTFGKYQSTGRASNLKKLNFCPYCGKKIVIKVTRRTILTYTYRPKKRTITTEEEIVTEEIKK